MDLKDLIAEFRVIGNAQEDVGKFDYIFPADININKDKDFPFILLSKHPKIDYVSFGKSQRIYTFNIDFFDLQLEATTDVDTDLISDMENIAEQYFRKFEERYKADPVNKPWHLMGTPVLSGNAFAFQHNDKLAGIGGGFQVKTYFDCDTGTFSY